MNRGRIIVGGVFLVLAASWFGTLMAPHLQIGDQAMVMIEETGAAYPSARPGVALRGREVYRANGCFYCHTQQVRSSKDGPDIARGWGSRRTVARDYLREKPVMLGSLRIGPDLTNAGVRQTNTHALLLRLYNPRLETPGSIMPAHPFLFERRKLGPTRLSSPDALRLPSGAAPAVGEEIVPRPDALALAAYLQSLNSEPFFFEAFPQPGPPTK